MLVFSILIATSSRTHGTLPLTLPSGHCLRSVYPCLATESYLMPLPRLPRPPLWATTSTSLITIHQKGFAMSAPTWHASMVETGCSVCQFTMAQFSVAFLTGFSVNDRRSPLEQRYHCADWTGFGRWMLELVCRHSVRLTSLFYAAVVLNCEPGRGSDQKGSHLSRLTATTPAGLRSPTIKYPSTMSTVFTSPPITTSSDLKFSNPISTLIA